MATEHGIVTERDINGGGVSGYEYIERGTTITGNAPVESPIVERIERTYTQVADVRLALETLCGALLGDEKTRGEPIMPDRGAFMPHLHSLVSAIDHETDYVRMLITRISKGVR